MLRTVLVVAVLSMPVASFAQNPISRAIQQQWAAAKGNVIASADQMPEADYGFKPVATVRSFGGILAHVAGANYVFCAPALGEKSPFEEDHFEKTATTKAAIAKAVRDSAAYCDKAYGALTDQTAAQMIAMPFGDAQGARADALMGNTGHVQEHYGNLVTYFRVKGMVPPSSRAQ